MAETLVAGECRKISSRSSRNGNNQDTVTEVYRYMHSSDEDDHANIYAGAEAATGDPIPPRRGRYFANNLFAERFSVDREHGLDNKRIWLITVDYETPQVSGGSALLNEYRDQHPLYWPPRTRLEYLEREHVVEQARNVQAITAGFGRAADTLGPIVNGAIQPLAETIYDVARDAVIVIQRNVESLATVLQLNNDYQLTTNDDVIEVFGESFAARQLKYLGTDCTDEQTFDGIPYYPIETRIQITKTTDRKIRSLGFKYYDGGGDLVNAMDDKESLASEPVFIALDGTKTATPTSIDYYYLTEVDYSPLLG